MKSTPVTREVDVVMVAPWSWLSSAALTFTPIPSLEEIQEAERTIRTLVRETPVLPAGELSRRFGAPVLLKAENLQHTGSFKVRGATNKLARLSKPELAKGVVTASAGNHGQAVAQAAHRVGTQ